MSHPCGHPLPGGRHCGQLVADPNKLDCGRHRHQPDPHNVPPDSSGCQMMHLRPGAWKCLIHDPELPEWGAAVALGAQLPCCIPMSDRARVVLAKGTGMEEGTLQILANDPLWEVRKEVSENPSAPPRALAQLADDSGTTIRINVARHRNTPADVLDRLARDPSAGVRLGVAQNHNTAPPTLALLAEETGSEAMLRFAAGHRNTPPEVLSRLAGHFSAVVRYGVAWNSGTPMAALQQLARDPDPDVRRAAMQRLRKNVAGTSP